MRLRKAFTIDTRGFLRYSHPRQDYFATLNVSEIGLHLHKVMVTLSLYVHFQKRKIVLYGGTRIQTKTKKQVVERLKKYSFANLK